MAIVNGTNGGDTLGGTAGVDTITGGGGNDTITGLDGADILYGDGTVATATTRASTGTGGTQGNAASSGGAFAGSNLVVFQSGATNLVGSDTNGASDIFVKNLTTGVLTRVSTDASGNQGNGASYIAGGSSDGGLIVFSSDATNLIAGDTNGQTDIYVKTLSTGAIVRVSTSSAGVQGNNFADGATISGDGTRVAFYSYATNLVAGDTNNAGDVFVKNLSSGVLTRVSIATGGGQSNGDSDGAQLSEDGGVVAFTGYGSNLVAGDTNGQGDIFVHVLGTGVTTRVSTSSAGVQGNDLSLSPDISADGNLVVFTSYSTNLVAGDTNGTTDVFVKNLTTGALTRISTDSSGAQANGDSGGATISRDGTKVAFSSTATNLVAGDTNGQSDIFVKDLITGALTRVSLTDGSLQTNGFSFLPTFSADGSALTFQSLSTNIVAGDSNGAYDIFVVGTGASAGTPGDDSLDGGLGADQMTGGAGNDSYYVDNAGDQVTELSNEGHDIIYSTIAYTLPTHVERLILIGSSNVNATGNAGNNLLTGNAGNNLISGLDGGDVLSGEDGDDDLVGGAGTDKLYGGNGADDLVGGGEADRLEGGANVDDLDGGDGNDYLDGGTGADVMAGGLANDVYIVDDAGDQTIEAAGQGYDIVRNFISHSLAAEIEGLQLQGTGNINGTGNGLANNILGNSGANVLSGGAGVDTMDGGDGADTIVGGTGNDLLRGGSGLDTFRVLNESVNLPVLENDIVYDFSTLEGDRVDLSAIDANTLVGGDQAFALRSSLGIAGAMTLTLVSGQTLLRLDVDGDGSADYQMKINGDVTGASGGWLL